MLTNHQVDIWAIPLKPPYKETRQLEIILSAQEKKRAKSFRFPSLSQRYILAHGALRQILQLYLGIDAKDISIGADENGKPFLEKHKSIYISLSHSHELAVFALALTPVGIDVELLRPLADQASLVKRFFASSEADYILSVNKERLIETFFQFWTAKEAIAKATGLGLAKTLSQCILSQSRGHIQVEKFNISKNKNWALSELKFDGYIGTLAHHSNILHHKSFCWNSDLLSNAKFLKNAI